MSKKDLTAENLQPEPLENLENVTETNADAEVETTETVEETTAAIVEEPVAEVVVTEEPIEQEPVAEAVVTEEPVEQEPVAEAAVTDEPVEQEPVAEVVVTEETVMTDDTEHHQDLSTDTALLQELNEMDEHEVISGIEEEEEEELEFHEEIVEKYDSYDREKLVEILEETVKEENILKIKTRVALIKVAFLKLSKEYRQQMLDNHLGSGGTKENYTPAPDPVVEKFNHVFETYKKNKIKFNEHQEVIKLRNLDAKKPSWKN